MKLEKDIAKAKQSRKTVRLALLAALVLTALPASAGTLSTQVIGLFPKDVQQFAYADLKEARRFSWFPQLKEQMLPARFRQFEQFLASAGMDPNLQVEELAWAAVMAGDVSSEQVVGVALGKFAPDRTEQFYREQKLATVEPRGYPLFAFGSGAGAGDLFFAFLDSSTAIFGHRSILEQLIEVRFGAEESVLRNERVMSQIGEVNGRGTVWAVLDRSYTRLGLQQLVPEAAQFPEAGKLLDRIHGMLVTVNAGKEVTARFQALCESPEEASVFVSLLQAGLMMRRFQEQQSNPDLAKLLEDTKVLQNGDRMDVRMNLTEDLLLALLRRNAFAVKI